MVVTQPRARHWRLGLWPGSDTVRVRSLICLPFVLSAPWISRLLLHLFKPLSPCGMCPTLSSVFPSSALTALSPLSSSPPYISLAFPCFLSCISHHSSLSDPFPSASLGLPPPHISVSPPLFSVPDFTNFITQRRQFCMFVF